MKQFLIIQLFFYFGWLSCIAVAQLDISSAITGSASFPHVGITCLGNLAVFITSFIRKRLDLEMAARDFLATITGPCKFKKIRDPCKFKEMQEITGREQKGTVPDEETGACRFKENNKHELIAVTTGYLPVASVVMLTNSAGMTNSSIRQFMKYICNAHYVQSVLMKYDIQKKCAHANEHYCNCILIREVSRNNMPQELENKSGVLLPSLKCRENKCHACNRDLFQLDGLDVKFSSAVYDALDFQSTTSSENEAICLCIPVTDDKWTNLLVRSLKYKDQGDKGAIVAAADALQNYLDKRGEDRAEEIKYKTVSLIVIRLVEIFVNLLLTVFFKVDGFSSALAARRAVRSYVVDSKGNGLPANVFLTSGLVVVKSDSVCQVLKFRGNRFFLLMLLSTCFVNLLCAIAWAVVLIAFNGGIGKWYVVPSMAPSKPRVAVIIAAICIGIVMDCFEFRKLAMECIQIFRNGRDSEKPSRDISNEVSNGTNSKTSSMDISNEVSNDTDSQNPLNQIWEKIKEYKRNRLMILVVIIFEIAFAVVFGLNKRIGRWVYGALQLLVWVKWLSGSFILGAYSPEYVPTRAKRKKGEDGGAFLDYSSAQWDDEGSLVYSSSFLLNAVMVGVMGDWAGIWSTWK